MDEQKSDEISLRELILKFIEWKNYLLTKWKVIMLAVIIGSGIGLGYSFLKKPVYTAELTFALEEKSSGSSLGAYAGIASQFGIDLGGDGGAFSGDNILELMKSRLLIENTLLTPVMINGKKETLVNRYILFYKLREKWEKNPELRSVSFDTSARENFSVLQDSLLFTITSVIKKNMLQVSKVDKKLNIVNVQCISEDQLFAKYFVEELVKNVSGFYISTKTQKSRTNVQLLQSRTDSVQRALDREMYGAAVSQDQNQNLVRAQARVPGVKRQMNVQMLTTMYGELVKNLELSKFALSREEPLIQVIDKPILPLKKEKFGKAKGIVLGGFLAGVLTTLWIVLNALYKKIITV